MSGTPSMVTEHASVTAAAHVPCTVALVCSAPAVMVRKVTLTLRTSSRASVPRFHVARPPLIKPLLSALAPVAPGGSVATSVVFADAASPMLLTE